MARLHGHWVSVATTPTKAAGTSVQPQVLQNHPGNAFNIVNAFKTGEVQTGGTEGNVGTGRL